MKTFAIIISIFIIIGGQFAKYRYDTSKNKEHRTLFFKSHFFWSALYEIGIIFLGAILAIQLTEFSEQKIAHRHTISVLQQVSKLVSNETVVGNIPYDIENMNDDDYTENIRNDIYIFATNSCNTVENIISQSEIQTNLSTKSYIRFMGILSRIRSYSNEIIITDEPSYIYQQIQSEFDSLISCISLEIEFQEGTKTEDELGSWIGQLMSFSHKKTH